MRWNCRKSPGCLADPESKACDHAGFGIVGAAHVSWSVSRGALEGAPSARTLCSPPSALFLAWKSSWGQWSSQRQAWAGPGRSGAGRHRGGPGRAVVGMCPGSGRSRKGPGAPWHSSPHGLGLGGQGQGAGSRQGARAWEVRGRADRMGRRRKTTPVLIWKNLTELSSIWEAQGSVPLRLSAAPACTSHPGQEAQPSSTAREGPRPPSPAGQRASHTAWHPSSITRCPPSTPSPSTHPL